MASYTSPSLQTIQETTGVNLYALGDTEAELGGRLRSILSRAEADIAQIVTDGVFDGTGLTVRQVALLQEAVCYAAAARFLRIAQLRAADGTPAAVLVEDSRSVGEVSADFTREAARLAGIVADGGGQVMHQTKTNFTDEIPDRVFARDTVW